MASLFMEGSHCVVQPFVIRQSHLLTFSSDQRSAVSNLLSPFANPAKIPSANASRGSVFVLASSVQISADRGRYYFNNLTDVSDNWYLKLMVKECIADFVAE